jgi:hypothetical protein
MADHSQQAIPAVGHVPEVAHEPSDLSVRSIIIFAGGFVLFMAVVLVLLWWYTQYLAANEARAKAGQFPLAAADPGQLPPAPVIEGFDPNHKVGRLQPKVTETPDLLEGHRDGYGMDATTGKYRIPVERAMELLEKRLADQSRRPAKKEEP